MTARYGADLDGTTPTKFWIVFEEERPIGFLQEYRLRDYPDYAALTPVPDAVGVDYAIGVPDAIGRGLGTRMLWAWAGSANERFPGVRWLFAAPDRRNGASVRALEKAGFVPGEPFDEPDEEGRLTRVVPCQFDVDAWFGRGRRFT